MLGEAHGYSQLTPALERREGSAGGEGKMLPGPPPTRTAFYGVEPPAVHLLDPKDAFPTHSPKKATSSVLTITTQASAFSWSPVAGLGIKLFFFFVEKQFYRNLITLKQPFTR